MSKRRQAGDIVRKKANAGFIGEELIICLHPEANNAPCMLNCGDDNCLEWADCEIIIDGKSINDFCYHVSECEMEDF